MNIITFNLEGLDFPLHIPDSKVPEINNILSTSNDIPFQVKLNDKKFMMMSEEKFEELLEMDDDQFYYDFLDGYDDEDSDEDSHETYDETSADETSVDELDSIFLRLIQKEVLADTLLSMIMLALDEKVLSVKQLSRLEKIVSAQHLLAIEREKLGEECK